MKRQQTLMMVFAMSINVNAAAEFDGMKKQYPQMFEGGVSLGFSTLASAKYLVNQQAYRVDLSAGAKDEQGYFLYRKIKGNFIITAHVELAAMTDALAEAGLMLRESLTDSAGGRAVSVTGKTQLIVSSEANRSAGKEPETVIPAAGTNVLQLERHGQILTLSYARFGETFTRLELESQHLPEQFYVGLFARSSASQAVQANFRNVRITIPAWEGLVPYRDYLGSRLELLQVAVGERQIVYSTSAGIEAPNWLPADEALIYNSGGHLYRFDLASKTPQMIDTGFANKNNNDHVLSFDGKQLAISHHTAEPGGKSIVYKLPVTGGQPQPLTLTGPSYMHGWSPDGRYVIYTAERNGQYDIYRTTSDGKGHEEQLTDTPELDDGSEYSPDGKSIYFNSARNGRMQLWRMDANGNNPRALTDDEFNNWFPHVSPDGRMIVFLSYLPDVAPGEHPYYQQVYLRAMPTSGGRPTVIAYLYGGQGTINVPSWSSDSQRVAFVSHSVIAG